MALAFSNLGLDWQEHVEINRKLFHPSEIMISKADPSQSHAKLGWEPRYTMPQVVEMLLEADQGHQG